MILFSADGSVRLFGIFLLGQVPACFEPTLGIPLVLFPAAAVEVVRFSRCVRAWREAECGFIVSVTEFKQHVNSILGHKVGLLGRVLRVTLVQGQHLGDDPCVSLPTQHIL